MPDYLKPLIYILIISMPVFMLAKKVAAPFIPLSEFRLWRNCWLIATCAVFFSSSFLVFALVMLLLSMVILKRSASPLHLYIILLFVTPCIAMIAGIPGLFGKILDINPPRLLALFILLPVAIRLWQDKTTRVPAPADILVGAFVALISLLAMRDPLPSSAIRIVIGYLLDIALPYFVFSRGVRTARDIDSILLAFAVATMPFAAIGVFEVSRSWRLYNITVENWGNFLAMPYLFRDGMLRAAVTAIEPIAFGFVCMTGAGCLLALHTNAVSAIWRLAAIGVLAGGLLASISRGPWLGFAVCCLVMALAKPRFSLKIMSAAALPALMLAFIFGRGFDRFLNLLPFVGNTDPGTVSYRSDLFRNALIVIERSPLFGSITFLSEPEMLRMIQGQGIIDIVNSYLQVALEFGLAGLVLFAGYFAYITLKLALAFRAGIATGVNHAALLGILVGILFTISTTSSVTFIPYLYWAFSGLCVAALKVIPEHAPHIPKYTSGRARRPPSPRILGKYRI